MKENNRKLLLLIFLSLMIISLISLISWYFENKNTKKIVEKEEKYVIEEKYLDEKILKENPDTVAWIRIKGTGINCPVVQAKDNEYYLNHNFKKEKSSAGWVFMDYQNNLDDQNIVLYGHHRRDNSMFGDIDLLFNKDFYKNNNNEILLITTNKVLKYKIFSVYKSPSTEPYNFKNIDNFNKKLKQLKNKSEISFNEDIENTSQIITLSTCHNNNKDRLVVHGIKTSLQTTMNFHKKHLNFNKNIL